MDEPILSPPIEGADLVTQALEIIKSIEKSIQLQLSVGRASPDVQESLQSLEVIKYLLEGFVSAVRQSHAQGSQLSDSHMCALYKFSKGLIALDDIIKSCEHKMAVPERRFLPFSAKLGYALNNKQQNALRQWIESAKVHFTLPLEEDPRNLFSQALTSKRDRREEGNQEARIHVDTPYLRDGNISQTWQITCKRPRRKYITTYKLGIAELAITRSDQDKENQPVGIEATEFEITLSFAPWLLNRAYTLATHRSQQGWTRTLRSTILVSPDDDIFRLCAQGDALGVRNLIADGRASPHSVTYHDITPLFVAAKNHHAAVIKVLLELHGDIDQSPSLIVKHPAASVFKMTPLSWALHPALPLEVYDNIPDTWQWRSTDATAFRDTIRALVEQGHCTLDAGWESIHNQEENILQVDRSWSFSYFLTASNVDDFRWLTEPGQLGYWGSDLQAFYITILYQLFGCSAKSELVLVAFSRISDWAQLVNSRSTEDLSDAVNLIEAILFWFLNSQNKSADSGIAKILGCLPLASIDNWIHGDREKTALKRLVYVSLHVMGKYLGPLALSRHFRERLNDWIGVLKSAGVNLRKYVCEERKRRTWGLIRLEDPNFEQGPNSALWSMDRDWYCHLDCIKPYEEDQESELRDFRIKVRIVSAKRKYKAPGAWPDDEANGDEQSQRYYTDFRYHDNEDDEYDYDYDYDYDYVSRMFIL